MSLFPKRALPGQAVTVHWCFRGPAGDGEPLCPFVRIGVRDPAGTVRMLHEKTLIDFPPPRPEPGTVSFASLQPGDAPRGPMVPLLVLASYLEGRRKRETLAEMLVRLREGRHFYFHHVLAPDAALGRHTLISEIHWQGRVIPSATADEDFFHVERLEVVRGGRDGAGEVGVRNPGPEPVPARLVEAFRGSGGWEYRSRDLEIPSDSTHPLKAGGERNFLLFSEDREVLSLDPVSSPFCLRSPEYHALAKEAPSGIALHLLHARDESGFVLVEPHRSLWDRADGLATRNELRSGEGAAAYDEMLAAGLLRELPVPEGGRL